MLEFWILEVNTGKFCYFLEFFVLGFWILGDKTRKVCYFLEFLCWDCGYLVLRLGKFVTFFYFRVGFLDTW